MRNTLLAGLSLAALALPASAAPVTLDFAYTGAVQSFTAPV